MNWWQIIVVVSLTLYGRWLWDKVQDWRVDQAAQVIDKINKEGGIGIATESCWVAAPSPQKTITARLVDRFGQDAGRLEFDSLPDHFVHDMSAWVGMTEYKATDWQYEIDGETIVIFQEVE